MPDKTVIAHPPHSDPSFRRDLAERNRSSFTDALRRSVATEKLLAQQEQAAHPLGVKQPGRAPREAVRR